MVFSSRGFRLLNLGKISVSKREDRKEETKEKKERGTDTNSSSLRPDVDVDELHRQANRQTDKCILALDALAQRHIHTYTYKSS